MSRADIQKIVSDNLNNAIDNGYSEFNGWTNDEIALDLILYASDCSCFTKEQLIPFVDKWQKGRE